MNIEGKVALVTGSNRGIGLALVECLLSRGVKKVYAGVRDTHSYDKSAALSDPRVQVIAFDVTSTEDIKTFAESVACLDVIFNNAGIASGSGFTQGDSMAVASNEITVNYLGPLNVINQLASVIKRDNTAIVNIASIAAISGYAAMGTYSASKAALHSMTQSLRGELSAHQVIGVYPGPTDTRLTAGIDIAKAAPSDVANRVIQALNQGEQDVFPDDFSARCYEGFLDDPKALEASFSQSFVGG